MHNFSRNKYLIRVVDDEKELLEAIEFILNTEGWRVKTYDDPEIFLNELDLSIPGCVILDVKMPQISGPEIQEILNEKGVLLPIIFLTGHGDMNTAIHAFRNGALDFLQKPIDPDELMHAIMKAIDKEEKNIIERTRMSALARYNSLTDQQKRVIEDMALGLEREAISEHLGISLRTLQRHRQYAMKKLGLRNPEDVAGFLEQAKKEEQESVGVSNPFSAL